MSAAAISLRHDPARKGYEACTGCNLCVLPCPVFQQTRDLSLTLKGRAKALQAGATLESIAPSLAACVVCGACEPVCPEDIDTVGRTLDLRAQLTARGAWPLAVRAEAWMTRNASGFAAPVPHRAVTLLAGVALGANARVLAATVRALGGPERVGIAENDGRELAVRIEAGLPLFDAWNDRFGEPLREARDLVVAEGLLHTPLRRMGLRPRGLGEALLEVPAIRKAIRLDDLYVIETRGFHADFQRLVKLYHELRVETGCTLNLDLQRAATPTGAGALQHRLGDASAGLPTPREQVAWLLQGRKPGVRGEAPCSAKRVIQRVVLEDLADAAPFRDAGVPVVHLAEVDAWKS